MIRWLPSTKNRTPVSRRLSTREVASNPTCRHIHVFEGRCMPRARNRGSYSDVGTAVAVAANDRSLPEAAAKHSPPRAPDDLFFFVAHQRQKGGTAATGRCGQQLRAEAVRPP